MEIDREITALKRLTVSQLQARYAEVFGERPRGRHRAWLIRRIAWRGQANAEGDLSERALRRALELANDADLRVTPPSHMAGHLRRGRGSTTAPPPPPDPRLPMPGTILTRKYKGQDLVVSVLADGFEFRGTNYPSLSAVAKAVTGSHWNGFHFFNLSQRGGPS